MEPQQTVCGSVLSLCKLSWLAPAPKPLRWFITMTLCKQLRHSYFCSLWTTHLKSTEVVCNGNVILSYSYPYHHCGHIDFVGTAGLYCKLLYWHKIHAFFCLSLASILFFRKRSSSLSL